MYIPFLRPNITDADIKNMVRSVKTGWLVCGPETTKFEEKLARYLGVKDAVMMNSATSALHIALILAGVEEGDEVITTPLSYVATSNVMLHQRAKVVFVDVDPQTGLMDLTKIEKYITKKTKAIMPVHLYGQMIDMVELNKIALKHKLHIIEDAAHAIESERDGIKAGQQSFAACFSFHAAKNITCGQGGALVTNDLELAKKARRLRRDGVVNKDNRRYMIDLGHKYDAADFQAALLLGQMDRIKTNHKARQRVFHRYAQAFGKNGVDFPHYRSHVSHACHMFIILVEPSQRDAFREELLKKGVETSIHYHPIHLEPFYKETFGYKEGDYPNAEYISSRTITLPTYPGLTTKEQDYIIKEVIRLSKNI